MKAHEIEFINPLQTFNVETAQVARSCKSDTYRVRSFHFRFIQDVERTEDNASFFNNSFSLLQ
ncbi:MAG TPA: hypothetical protein VN763_15435, partial [Saprospiraceae bacterium]|nr:hypothetical protein [Saprospiraceae bacterium]